MSQKDIFYNLQSLSQYGYITYRAMLEVVTVGHNIQLHFERFCKQMQIFGTNKVRIYMVNNIEI